MALHDVKVSSSKPVGTKNSTMLRVGVANVYWILVMHTKVCNYYNYYY
jgi:hypothetical protein